MAIVRPPPNPIGSAKVFEALCLQIAKPHKFRVSNEAIRHLRLTMVMTKTQDNLEESLSIVFAGLACKNDKKKKKLTLDDIKDWLAPDAGDDGRAEDLDPDEVDLCVYPSAAAMAIPEAVYGVRRILDCIRLEGITYYLVDWKPTWEKRENISSALIAAFKREHRALVRRAFFEDEAIEDNPNNVTES